MVKTKTIVVNDYKKYWISDTVHGSVIKICHGNSDSILEIDMRWRDRKREAGGRVVSKK